MHSDLILSLVLLSLVVRGRAQCSDGAVELEGLPVSHAGIVRVCVNGVWGTICAERTTPWSEKNSLVACRSAGYAGAINPILHSTFSAASVASVSGDPIHYRSVRCNGTETDLLQCSLSDNTAACTHNFDAAVTCKPYSDAGIPSGDVRLLGDTNDGRGAVEYYDQRFGWTGVCVDSFFSSQWLANTAAATVVCRQLGYDGGTTYLQDGISTSTLQRRVAGSLACTGAEVNLDACSSQAALCDSTVQLAGGVACTATGLADYSVRLVGGDDRSGVVEVVFNGRWGTICEDSDWSVEDATVICTQLGFTADVNSVIISNNYPGFHSQSVKPVWLSGMICIDTETALNDCSYDPPIGFSTCSDPSSLSAEISCLSPTPSSGGGGLSGGAIAGIVIGSIIGLGVIGTVIHLWSQSEKKKKAAAAAGAQRQPAPTVVQSAHPPPPIPAPQQPPLPTDVTELASFPMSSQRDSRPQGGTEVIFPPQPPPELVAAAPPSYEAAVSFPTATASTPPSFPEKTGPYPPEPYPNSSAAYPPPTHPTPGGGLAYPPPAASAPPLHDPYPPPLAFNPAYPPPAQDLR